MREAAPAGRYSGSRGRIGRATRLGWTPASRPGAPIRPGNRTLVVRRPVARRLRLQAVPRTDVPPMESDFRIIADSGNHTLVILRGVIDARNASLAGEAIRRAAWPGR